MTSKAPSSRGSFHFSPFPSTHTQDVCLITCCLKIRLRRFVYGKRRKSCGKIYSEHELEEEKKLFFKLMEKKFFISRLTKKENSLNVSSACCAMHTKLPPSLSRRFNRLYTAAERSLSRSHGCRHRSAPPRSRCGRPAGTAECCCSPFDPLPTLLRWKLRLRGKLN